ncbi:MAG TPA: polysaccharide deacetylase family protein [Aggregatilineales bacterium]|nr:polysaccharide deacetylase family protein [Aggregatilineales bacterium]
MRKMNESETNRRLGYPADARLLIINADDFGMCHAINAAILRSLKEGVVCSTTLMVPCAWASHATRLLRENPDIPFGVHLTAIGDNVDYRWRPVTCRDKVPSLVDEMGYFYSSERSSEFLAQVKLEELEVEFRAQLETVLAAKLKPTHLDWHSLRIGGRPDIFDILLGLAKEYGLALRVAGRSSIEKVQHQGLPTNDHDFLDSYMLDPVGKSARLAQMLRDLPVGLSEWAVHPALEDAELLAIEPDGKQFRQTDFDFVIAAEAREIIDQEGIILLSYNPLQEVWQNR